MFTALPGGFGNVMHTANYRFLFPISCTGITFAFYGCKTGVPVSMENKITSNPFYPIVVVFFVITLLVFGLMSHLHGWNIDSYVILGGNIILFIATFLSFRLYRKGLQTTSTHTFLRMTYSGMLLKMGICIVAVVGYGIVSSGRVNKAAIFACIAFYFLYSFLEVRLLTRLSKERKNA